MKTTPVLPRHFSPDLLAGLDEPVRRYLSHAIGDGALLSRGIRMTMSGRIKVGLWLPFTAEQTVDGRSFTWRARVGRGLRVTDQYANGAGSTEGRLLGRVTLFGAHDADTARSAATRAAIESVVFAPPAVLPDRGVTSLRSGTAGEKTFRYIPFGGEINAARRFGDLLHPSRASVGWWFETARYAPFFRADISSVTPTR